jgi:hypothetical protein
MERSQGRFGMKAVADTLAVARSNLIERVRVFALIAPDRFSGLQAEPAQNTADSGWRDPDLHSNLPASPALAA